MKILYYYLFIILFFSLLFAGYCNVPDGAKEILIINKTEYKIDLDFKISETDTLRCCQRYLGSIYPFSSWVFDAPINSSFNLMFEDMDLQMFLIPDSVETEDYCGREDQWRWIVGRKEYTLQQLDSLNWTIVVE